MTTSPQEPAQPAQPDQADQPDQPDQDAEPSTPTGEAPDTDQLHDATAEPASDPDPEPGQA